MNWIFTLVFSGVLFSSNAGTTTDLPSDLPVTPPPANALADETEHFEQTYPLTANGRVSLSNVNGSITVEAWDRNEVKVVAVKTADTKEHLQDVEIRVDAKPDSVSIESNYDNWKTKNENERWRNNKLTVDYQLMVPAGAVLDEIETVNGSITISNFTNLSKVSAVNGTVKATNLRGTANLSTVNGEVIGDFTTLDPGSKISLSTVNGKVDLTIPSDANATVKVDSLNGNITNDFGLPVRKGKYIGRDMYGKLGSGDVKIKLDSVNGDLKIGRQNDGKTPSPVTDMLPQKDKDSDDWDTDSGVAAADAVKAEKEAEKAVAASQRASEAAVRQAQVEIANVAPQIARAATEVSTQVAVAVNTAEIQKTVNVTLERQKEIMAKIADAAFYPSVPRVERKSDSIPVDGMPTVNVESHNCSVKVTGWDKPEVQYQVTQLSTSRKAASPDITESHNGSDITIKVTVTDPTDRTRIEIFVPKKSNLKINTDSEIRLDGVSGELDLTGGEESINVRDGDGRLGITSGSGRIRVIGFKGEVTTESADGMTNLEGDFSKLSARADNGSIVITLPDNASANITSESKDPQIDGLPLVVVGEKDGVHQYRLGKGDADFKIATDGDVILRSSGSIVSTN